LQELSYRIYENLAELNAVDRAEAMRVFESCCGSTRWAESMADTRPFNTIEHLVSEAEEAWFLLPAADQLQAYNRGTQLSEGIAADDDTVRQLQAIADLYNEKFGFRLVVNASGRAVDEVLAIAGARLRNSAQTELKLAAEEQSRIIQVRLAQLLER